MKRLLYVTMMLFCAVSLTFAQVQPQPAKAGFHEPDIEDYERYINKKLEMDFRMKAIEALGLTTDEINRFNPRAFYF